MIFQLQNKNAKILILVIMAVYSGLVISSDETREKNLKKEIIELSIKIKEDRLKKLKSIEERKAQRKRIVKNSDK